MNTPLEHRPRSRAQVWILAGVFFVPLALAFALYYGTAGWRPPGSTNYGELIAPPRPLPSVELSAAFGTPLTGAAWRGKWTLVYIGDGSCDARCREALTLTRQTRLALNKDMTRVQRVFLVSSNCCDHAYLRSEHADLIVASLEGQAGASLLAQFPDATTASRSGYLYIVDPLGNLMMRYPPASAPKGLLADLKKLLKLSHIG